MRIRRTRRTGRARLTATIAGFCVLFSPLCSVACLPTAGPTDMAGMAHDEAPCHEAPSEAPATPGDAHDDCGCRGSSAAVSVGPVQETCGSGVAVLLHGKADTNVPNGRGWALVSLPREADLPPPDVLLLKSSLVL